MPNRVTAAKFSLEEVKPKFWLREFKETIRPNGFIEIVDGSKEESLELILKFIQDIGMDTRIAHIGNAEIFEKTLPVSEMNTILFPKEMADDEKKITYALRIRPDFFIINHNFINYMERDYIKNLYLTGHNVIFY